MPAEPALARLRQELLEADRSDLVVRATLLYLLAENSGQWFAQLAILTLGILGMLTSLWRSPWLWAVLTFALAVRVEAGWTVVDNHDYLTAYWAFAIFLSLWAREPRALELNGRLLIGLCFLFATLWKGLLSPDYMDGAFFHHTFIQDPRFASLGSLAGGMDEELFRENVTLTNRQLSRATDPPSTIQLHTTPQLARLAKITTWFTVLIEGLIAVAFLWPGALFYRARDGILLVFCWGTYAIAPVPGFGALLMLMGIAQTDARLVRGLYLGTFFLVYAYKWVPWQQWLGAVLS